MIENENTGDKLLQIKTTGRDDSKADQNCYPYEPSPYSVMDLFEGNKQREEVVVFLSSCDRDGFVIGGEK